MKFSTRLGSVALSIASFGVMAAFQPMNAQAQGANNASCVIYAHHKNGHKGPCVFEQFGGDGSFRVSNPYDHRTHGQIGDYLFYEVKMVRPGVARVRGYLAGGRYDSWGTVYRSQNDSACWESRPISICAY